MGTAFEGMPFWWTWGLDAKVVSAAGVFLLLTVLVVSVLPALCVSTVDPIALLHSDGKDYLDAWCHQAGGRRLFRLSRVQSVTVLDTPRAGPDVEPRDLAHGLFEPDPDDAVARVRLSPELRWFVDYYPVTAVTEAGSGALEVELRVSDPLWLVRLALRMAPGLEVLEPDDVRRQVRDNASSARALYPPA
jgi:proteasome accessory factor C